MRIVGPVEREIKACTLIIDHAGVAEGRYRGRGLVPMASWAVVSLGWCFPSRTDLLAVGAIGILGHETAPGTYQSGDRALGVTQIQVRCGAIHLALGEVLGGYRARGRKGRTDRGPTPEGVGGDRGRLSGLGGGGHPFAETVIGEGRDDTGLTIGDGS